VSPTATAAVAASADGKDERGRAVCVTDGARLPRLLTKPRLPRAPTEARLPCPPVGSDLLRLTAGARFPDYLISPPIRRGEAHLSQHHLELYLTTTSYSLFHSFSSSLLEQGKATWRACFLGRMSNSWYEYYEEFFHIQALIFIS
jgi:hypothetical protein